MGNEKTAPASGRSPSGAPREALERVLATADRVAVELGKTAALSDRANKSPREEVELLRKHDLLPSRGDWALNRRAPEFSLYR